MFSSFVQFQQWRHLCQIYMTMDKHLHGRQFVLEAEQDQKKLQAFLKDFSALTQCVGELTEFAKWR